MQGRRRGCQWGSKAPVGIFQTGELGSAVAALDNGDLPFSTNADTINALAATTVLCPQRVPETLEAHAAFRSCCKYPLSLYSELQRKTCVCCRAFVGRAGCLDSDECPQLRGGADRIWRQWSWPRFAPALPALRPGASHVMGESATGAGHLHPPAPMWNLGSPRPPQASASSSVKWGQPSQ